MDNTVVIMQKLNSMINSNVLIIGMLVFLIAVLVMSLYFFLRSLISTLTTYHTRLQNTKEFKNITDSLNDRAADNEYYPEPRDPNSTDFDDSIVGERIDPTKFMPRKKREFLKNIELENKDYNAEKTEMMIRRLNYPENDDIVDSKILYKDYDDYKYDYEEA